MPLYPFESVLLLIGFCYSALKSGPVYLLSEQDHTLLHNAALPLSALLVGGASLRYKYMHTSTPGVLYVLQLPGVEKVTSDMNAHVLKLTLTVMHACTWAQAVAAMLSSALWMSLLLTAQYA